ncbi:post-PEP-CTERM-1 domain-containing protein [Arenimonas aestuarii]
MTIFAPRPLAATLAMALCLTLPATAAEQATPDEPGSRTAIDRDTGRLRATTAAEDRALARDAVRLQAQRRPIAAPGVATLVRPATEAEALQTQVRHADGSVSMMVPENFDSELRVTRAADGALVISHNDAGETDHAQE